VYLLKGIYVVFFVVLLLFMISVGVESELEKSANSNSTPTPSEKTPTPELTPAQELELPISGLEQWSRNTLEGCVV
jgi:hypothetical protein